MAGNYAYVAEGGAGVQVLDISNPANPVALGCFDSGGPAGRVFVAENRVYVAEGAQGFAILRSTPNVQFTLQVNGTLGTPFTIEATTNLSGLGPWTRCLAPTQRSCPSSSRIPRSAPPGSSTVSADYRLGPLLQALV